jgi:hypothetical protein
MISSVVKSWYARKTSSKVRHLSLKKSSLGCWGSLVQIQSRRPTYLYEFTNEIIKNSLIYFYINSAQVCSKMRAKAGDIHGKIVVKIGINLASRYVELIARHKAMLINIFTQLTINLQSLWNWPRIFKGVSWII